MDTICPKQLEKFIYLRTNGQQEIVQSLPLLAMTWDWHSQCLRKQLGVLGYNKYDYRKSIVIDYVSVCYTDFVKRTTYHQKKIMSHQCHNHKFCVPKK